MLDKLLVRCLSVEKYIATYRMYYDKYINTVILHSNDMLESEDMQYQQVRVHRSHIKKQYVFQYKMYSHSR